MPLKLTTYYHGKDIPSLPGSNTFHSTELFQIYEATPGYTPLLIVATEDGKPVARLLAAIRKAKRWLPAFLSKHCVVYGEGELLDESLLNNKEKAENVFGDMLEHLTQEASRSCVLIEFKNLNNAMFGYRVFRSNDYFPVNWLRVRNSLHSLKKTEDRFSPSRIRQIKKGLANGAKVEEAHTVEEIQEFSKMLHKIYSSRIRRYFPANDFFHHMNSVFVKGNQAKIFIVRYKEKIIGGSVCIYSDEDAYLWFSGGMRKTYALQNPGVLAVWKALDDARQRGLGHLEFMDVGLPFRKHGYRDFVLRFGGKQSSTRRWFRVNWAWLNNLLVKFYV
ncbi:GNAT family N-acetyltransferase [uncultured Bacteroides sp.]|uniref:GNAT family N-acetyltransferase n=1 Tax=uncultured Bacteroides sp. TaxID=162156 RepID=UPI0025F13192|nr:GNAT family N-acetyltransferase [uncultured Bacteroides sp.]